MITFVTTILQRRLSILHLFFLPLKVLSCTNIGIFSAPNLHTYTRTSLELIRNMISCVPVRSRVETTMSAEDPNDYEGRGNKPGIADLEVP